MTSYTWRKSLFEKTARIIEFDATRIRETRGNKFTEIALSDIRRLRVTYAPTRAKLDRYVAVITGPGGTIAFESTSFESVGSFTDQSEAFSMFMHGLLDQVAIVRPGMKISVGDTALNYFFQLLLALGTLALLAVVVLLLPVGSASWTSLAKAGIILITLPIFVRWIWRARPRGADVGARPRPYLPSH